MTLALILVIGVFLGLVGYLVIGLINTWLIQILLLGEAPSWPPNVIAAADQQPYPVRRLPDGRGHRGGDAGGDVRHLDGGGCCWRRSLSTTVRR